MFRKSTGAIAALMLLAVVACGGGQTNTAGLPGTSPQSSQPLGSAPYQTTSNGITSYISASGTGSIALSQSSSAPGGAAALLARERKATPQSVKPLSAGPNSALMYYALTATSATTITSIGFVNLQQPSAPTGSAYLAYWTGSAWVTIPATKPVPGTYTNGVLSVSGGAVNAPNGVSLAAGQSLYLAVYVGQVLLAPTPAPAAPVAVPTAQTLFAGTTGTISVTSGLDVTLTAKSSNTAVATVTASATTSATPAPGASTTSSATFTVNAIGVGTATITFTDPNGKTGTAAVTVSNVPPTPLASPASVIIGVTETSTIDVTAKPLTTITATSQNAAVATIGTPAPTNGNGNVSFTLTAVAPGTTTISFTGPAGYTGTMSVAVSAVKNGGFGNGLTGWTPCSFAHNPYGAPIVAPGAGVDDTTPQTTTTTAVTAGLSSLAAAVAPVPDSNPTTAPLPAVPSFGSNVALVGSADAATTNYPEGAFGLCQTISVPAATTPQYLSFWAWLGGSGYSFKYEDQEADILNSAGTSVLDTLFVEQACYLNPVGTYPGPIIAPGASSTSSCIPGGSTSYFDWLYGGYWQPMGPYDLNAYAGQTVTLFVGDWSGNSTETSSSHAQLLYVGNVQTSTSSTMPTGIPMSSRGRPVAVQLVRRKP